MYEITNNNKELSTKLNKNINKKLITKKINSYLDIVDIIYWINLDRSVERRNNMLEILDGITIPTQRISAVDGSKLSEDQLYSNYIFEPPLMRNKIEYAVLLSHLNTIKTFAESDKEYALILEDDLSVEYVPLWDKKVSRIIDSAPNNWDIIMLNYVTLVALHEKYTYNDSGLISCCGSYLINKRGAKKLLEMIYKDNKYVLLPNKIHTADNYIYSLLITYAYKYPYFTFPEENVSTIHDNHIAYHNFTKKLAYGAWRDKYFINSPTFIKIYIELNRHFKINIRKLYYLSILIFIIIILIIYKVYKKIMKNKKMKYNKK